MPRYFFHIADGAVVPDREGVELVDREEAWDMALKFVGEVLRDGATGLRPGQGWTLTVVEDEVQVCWRLNFRSQAFVPDPRRASAPA